MKLSSSRSGRSKNGSSAIVAIIPAPRLGSGVEAHGPALGGHAESPAAAEAAAAEAASRTWTRRRATVRATALRSLKLARVCCAVARACLMHLGDARGRRRVCVLVHRHV